MKNLPFALRLFERRPRHADSRFGDDPLPDYYDWIDCIRSKNSLDYCSHLQLNYSNDSLVLHDDETSDFNSTNADDEEAQRKLYRTVVPVMLTFCILSLVFNIMILLSLKWVKKTLSPTLLLSLSLTVADAYASLIIAVGLVVNSLLPIVYSVNLGPFHACYLLVLEAFRLGGMVVTVLHLLALAINHYIGILKPLHYNALVTRRTVLWAILSMWVGPVVFFLSYFSLVPDDGFQSKYCRSYQFLLHVPFRGTVSIMFFVPLIFMSVMYIHMFIVVKRHQSGMLQIHSGKQLHKSVKAIITTLLILGTYVIGWMPAVLFFVLTCLDCPVPFTEIHLWVRVPVGIFINSMILIKSFLDPIIYVARMPEIKGAMNAVIRTRCGLIADDRVDHRIHFMSEINRLTFMDNSRRSKVDLRSSVCNGQNQSTVY